MGQGKDAAPARSDRPDHPLSPAPGAVGLYVHVPFCRAVCTYCAFAKGEYEAGRAEAWLDGLEREIAVRAGGGRPPVDTLFLGGGTPSTLSPSQWDRLGALLHAGFEILRGAEFTSEANPESFTPRIAAAMAGIGVNRVSLGAQSTDPGELRLLGRIHGPEAPGRAVRTAREAGFGNLNLDLMYALPGQDERTFRRSLDAVLDLEPEHLSAYCLGLEPGTALAARVTAGELPAPDDDLAHRLYDDLVRTCAARGYPLYEISNFARPGRACRHNLRYWERRDFIALGPSAHGLWRGERWANPATLEGWIAAYSPGGHPPVPRPVPRSEARFEWVFLRLRLAEGFSESEFAATWGEPVEAVHGRVLERLAAEELLEREGGRVRLTAGARFVSDGVMAEFAPEP
jgi:oxygen-independent coproporphyrinogen-3 oxidase